MLKALGAIVRRDLLIAMRQRSDLFNTLAFFVIVVSLFPLGIGPEPNQLQAIAPGVVWVAALLSALLSFNRLFAGDHADGTLEQMLLSAHPLSIVVIGKIVSHWLTTGLPVVVIGPLLGGLFRLPLDSILLLGASLALGTPVLSLLGAIGAALTLGLRGGGALLAMLILPLYVPVLIFGAGVVGAASSGVSPQGYFLLLGACLLMALVLAPVAVSAALRISLE